MSWSQTLVVTWIQLILGAGLVLLAVRLSLRRIVQPVERIHLIQWTLATAMAAPVAMWLAPLPLLRLAIVAPARQEFSQGHSHRGNASVTTTLPVHEERIVFAGATPVNAEQPIPPAVAQSGIAGSVWVTREGAQSVISVSTTTNPTSTSIDAWTIAASVLIAIHAAASLWFFAQWLVGVAALRRLCRLAYGSTLDLEVAWNSLPGACGRDVELLISPAIDAPLTFGWRRPVVVVPQSQAETGGQILQFCLAHEWSHIERNDLLTWRATQFCQFLLWWHPSFWALRRELRLAQDMLADDRAATIGRGSLEYSELLVDLARQRMPAHYACALTFLDHPSQLMRRIRMLLQRPVSVRSRCRWTFSLAAAFLAIGSLLLAGGVRVDATPLDERETQLADDDEAKPADVSKAKADEPKPASKEDTKPAQPETRSEEELHYTGIIVDKYTRKGIPDATVIVRRSNYTPQKNDVLEESKHTTNDEGKYSFVIPPVQVANRYLYIELDVEHPDYADRKHFGYALGMIRKNETLGERPFFENVELWPAEPITGTVRAPDGQPVVGVKLQGYSRSSEGDFREYGSFTSAVTGEGGKFRLNLIKGGIGVFWVLPEDFAVTSRPIGKDRGDVGTIKLQPGVRVSGAVLSADGKPVAGLTMDIDYQSGGTEDLNELPVATFTSRKAVTNADGTFAFSPLSDGQYRLHVDEYAAKNREIDGVFVGSTVTLKEGVPFAPVKVQAVPHIIFNAQIYNSNGEKTGGHEFFLSGQIDGQGWHGSGTPNSEGTIAMKVPHGLEGVSLMLMTNEHGALRFRRGKGKELENRTSFNTGLGTLNDDVEGFEIIRYKAPIVMISAVDEGGRPIKDFKVAGAYPWGEQQYTLEGEMRSDVTFEHQQDGRYRTSQLVPDEKVTFTVTAKGFEPASEEISLPEGESKDLVITMKKTSAPSE